MFPRPKRIVPAQSVHAYDERISLCRSRSGCAAESSIKWLSVASQHAALSRVVASKVFAGAGSCAGASRWEGPRGQRAGAGEGGRHQVRVAPTWSLVWRDPHACALRGVYGVLCGARGFVMRARLTNRLTCSPPRRYERPCACGVLFMAYVV